MSQSDQHESPQNELSTPESTGGSPEPGPNPTSVSPAGPTAASNADPGCCQPVTGVFRFLYNHNPFYVISAALFVYGLKRLFRSGDARILFEPGGVDYIEPWGLLLSLAGVTLLMAMTAILIVRIGKVWEDARSIVLIVMLMLLAISVSVDELATNREASDKNPWQAVLFMLGGATFAVALCELLVRGMLVRLSLWWRLPLYLLLIQFFVYPAFLLPGITNLRIEQVRCVTAAYPLIAGLISLILVRAIRMGSQSVRDNGTPWSWPWFPWSPFPIMGLAVLFRSWSLTISFDAPYLGKFFWDTAFGVYFLVPFVLSILVLFLEIGIAEKKRRLVTTTMWLTPLLLVLAHPGIAPWGKLPAYSDMVQLVSASAGSPVYLTQLGIIAFYLWAWLRRVRFAETAVCATLLGLTILNPQGFTDSHSQLFASTINKWPIAIVAAIQLVRGMQLKSSFRIVGTAIAASFAASELTNNWASSGFSPIAAWHVTLIGIIVAGQIFKDTFAQFLRWIAPGLLSILTFVSIAVLAASHMAGWRTGSYMIVMTILAAVLGRILSNRSWYRIAILHCSLMLIAGTGWSIMQFFEMRLPDGTKPVIMAGLCFLTGVLISSFKSGLGNWLRRYSLTNRTIVSDSVSDVH
ncbi:MAG: hypothetical protein JNL58_28700 [Planctomyces sp.]|nr:hypothetical protein [Planctomyces sp.]